MGEAKEAQEGLTQDYIRQTVLQEISKCKETLMDDIHEIRTFVDHINTAFVLNESGQRDYFGHHSDHAARLAAAKAEKEFWETAKREALKGGIHWLFQAIKIILALAFSGFLLKIGVIKLPSWP